MPAPLPQTPEERAQQLSFLQNLMSEDPGILRKMVAGLTGLPHRASQGEFIEPGGETLGYASQFAVPGAPESALGTGGGRPFYSKLGEAVEGMQPKATGPQLMATLRNQGVKPEELQYSGFEKQFGAAPSVTKGEATSFLADNGVRVGEVVKSGQSSPAEGVRQFGGGSTKFSQYQLPGGQNYKELLLTLPDRGPQGSVPPRVPAWGFASAEDRARYEAGQQQFRSGHYDEPNVLAHIRMNDRVDANGNKTLFLEEIQSDWHQKGRKQGYYSPPKPYEFDAKTFGQDEHQFFVHSNGKKFAVGKGTVTDEADAHAYLKRYIDSTNKQDALQAMNYVPDAPFKKDWHELALKRAIKYAVDNGYDSVSWTPGKVQAERYDLSKHIDALNYTSSRNRLVAWKDGRKVIDEAGVPPSKLADYVGKEMADKIAKDQERTGSDITHFKGLELQVGGEGMNAFYDNMLPIAANKLGKKYGAKVGVTRIGKASGKGDIPGTVRIENPNGTYHNADASEASQEVWTLPITDAMRAEVGKKGMPLFTGGLPLPQNQHQDRARMLQNLPALMGNRS